MAVKFGRSIKNLFTYLLYVTKSNLLVMTEAEVPREGNKQVPVGQSTRSGF